MWTIQICGRYCIIRMCVCVWMSHTDRCSGELSLTEYANRDVHCLHIWNAINRFWFSCSHSACAISVILSDSIIALIYLPMQHDVCCHLSCCAWMVPNEKWFYFRFDYFTMANENIPARDIEYAKILLLYEIQFDHHFRAPRCAKRMCTFSTVQIVDLIEYKMYGLKVSQKCRPTSSIILQQLSQMQTVAGSCFCKMHKLKNVNRIKDEDEATRKHKKKKKKKKTLTYTRYIQRNETHPGAFSQNGSMM